MPRLTMEKIIPEFVRGQVYLIEGPDKNYVGQTKTHIYRARDNKWVPYGYEKRYKQHKTNTGSFEKLGRCTALNSAMKKYGRDKFTVRLLEECPIDVLDERETYYINVYNTLAPNGYNLETGGNKNKVLSAETRDRQSASKKAFYESAEGEEFKKRRGLEHKQWYQTSEGQAFKAAHAQKHKEWFASPAGQANIEKQRKEAAVRNDDGKIARFANVKIDSLRVRNATGITTICVYCEGKTEQKRIDVRYPEYNQEAYDRIVRIINAIGQVDTKRDLAGLLVPNRQDQEIAGTP